MITWFQELHGRLLAMTFKPPFALFSSATAFAAGEDPVWTTTETGTRKEALAEGRRRFTQGTAKRELLLCSTNPKPKSSGDTWRMAGFFNAIPKSYRPIATDQRTKYEGRRRNTLRKAHGDTVAQPVAEQPSVQQGQPEQQEYVLSLDPQTAGLFRDAFDLACQGHSVTVRVKRDAGQPVQPPVAEPEPEPAEQSTSAAPASEPTFVEPDDAPVATTSNGSAPAESVVG